VTPVDEAPIPVEGDESRVQGCDENPKKPAADKWRTAAQRVFIGFATLFLLASAVGVFCYWKVSSRVDKALSAGPFVHTFSFYAAPESIAPGDTSSEDDVTAALHQRGYRESATAAPGTYERRKDAIAIVPKDHTAQLVLIRIAKGQVAAITDATGKVKLPAYDLEPPLIANLSDAKRERRTPVHFSDLPPALVNAVVSVEDKRFFEHSGFDPYRIVKAAYVDVKENRKEQGASTLTMQLARNLWLDRDKKWRRKATELLITVHLEHKLNKEKIFEYYSNQVYLGRSGTFDVHGFGEASKAYFGKDVRKLNLPEAALLAGLIQRPAYLNPFRYPDRAVERRNLVLQLMRQNRYIDQSQYETAANAPLSLVPPSSEATSSQYFLDIAADESQKHLDTRGEHGSASVYTTLDLRLQSAADKAIRDGMESVEKLLKAKHKTGVPQVALIALDPHTGEVKALSGGRNYSVSQLNHALAKRPPGSSFKPFVYAAAMNTAIVGGGEILTPASTVVDAPTTFQYDRRTYAPDNFQHQFHGTVTFRQALAKSMNVAAVQVAQKVGFASVVALAKRAGMQEDIRPTPSVALGAYDVTPLEIAGAYTIFANGGTKVSPIFVSTARDQDGSVLYQHESDSDRVLDPRVAFLMTDMLQEVLRSGTAAGVRSRGFKLPAAGKTGTSHDGWFAGFTSELLCVVWVGFDDYTELGLEGAKSALPIWTEFMQEAARYKKYRDAKPFTVPAGVVRATVDPASGMLATSYCPSSESDYFIDGTQPADSCPLHNSEVPVDDNAPGAPVAALAPITVHSSYKERQ
jgi:penicillin-binding protein 1B